ncbi:uncharacterized protein KQ657_000406 [Scheffersomyces spartinae]|uniref:Uncharacterized protein n=1 Tax=Scheffersomyces spartinae TaxID=45513 RepID=A0A9P7V9E2_9ASCO|nr:uncharacterized protein KQ657_000406 [Scheffersomyces spartinae]KAG7193716.1 hypothetical protein KQ657_000406 [Scheffersomyces spartinae]
MSPAASNIDLSFLDIFSLIYQYETNHDVKLLSPILAALTKHKAIHPGVRKIDQLSPQIPTIDETSLRLIEAAEESMDSQWNESNSLNEEFVWDSIFKAIPILIIRMEFDQLNELLTKYSEMYQYTLQIDSPYSQNFFEYDFYHLLVNVLQLVFQGIDQPQTITALFDATTVQDSSSTLMTLLQQQQQQQQQQHLKQTTTHQNSRWQNLKAIEGCLKKAETYYAKNRVVLTQSFNVELHYYYLIKWFSLISLFKEFNVSQFVDQFERLYHQPSVITKSDLLVTNLIDDDSDQYDEDYSPFKLFSTCKEYEPIRNHIVMMYQVCLIVVRPFRELQILETDDVLLDLIEALPLNSKVYYDLMISLKQSDFNKFKCNINDLEFQSQMKLLLGNYLPDLKYWDFFRYILLLIDYKNFLLIMSVTRAIPKKLLIQKLGGYDVDDESVIPFLLQLMAILKLGEVGISYEVSKRKLLMNFNQIYKGNH